VPRVRRPDDAAIDAATARVLAESAYGFARHAASADAVVAALAMDGYPLDRALRARVLRRLRDGARSGGLIEIALVGPSGAPQSGWFRPTAAPGPVA